LGTIRVAVNWIWTITGIIWDRSHLSVWICEAIGEHDRYQVDPGQLWRRHKGKFLVLLVDDRSNVGCIHTAIALCGEMEGKMGILGEAGDEEFKERINIHTSDRARVHS